VNGKGFRGFEGVADKKAKIEISQRQHFVVSCLSSCDGNVFGLRTVCVCFPSTRKLVTQAKRTVWGPGYCTCFSLTVCINDGYFFGFLQSPLWPLSLPLPGTDNSQRN
jgi:hypothetical protein